MKTKKKLKDQIDKEIKKDKIKKKKALPSRTSEKEINFNIKGTPKGIPINQKQRIGLKTPFINILKLFKIAQKEKR